MCYTKPEKNKDIAITKSNKGNEVVIFDQKLYNNAIQKIVSDTYKTEKLNEEPSLKREASLQRFLHKLKQKKINENDYDKLHPSGSALALICGTAKIRKFSSSDSFLNRRSIVSSIGTTNCNLARFFFDFLSTLDLVITLAKILFLSIPKVRMQISPVNFLFTRM